MVKPEELPTKKGGPCHESPTKYFRMGLWHHSDFLVGKVGLDDSCFVCFCFLRQGF